MIGTVFQEPFGNDFVTFVILFCKLLLSEQCNLMRFSFFPFCTFVENGKLGSAV